MIVCSPIKSSTRIISPVSGHLQKQMTSYVCNIASPTTPSSCCLFLKQGNSQTRYSRICFSKASSCFSDCGLACQRVQYKPVVSSKKGCCPPLTFTSLASSRGSQKTSVDYSSWYQNVSVRIFVPKRRVLSNFKCNVGPFSWSRAYGATGLMSGLFVCYSTSNPAHAEAAEKGDKGECADSPSNQFSHGKKVYTDYSVIGIPGDGRCLFRSVAHGACLRSGKPSPNESHQKQLADELRTMVADEFLRRRQETEWFIEGDFETYVSQIRKPHVWGGEPELLMLSHVLRMPITVYMRDDKYGGLISIAEYGQEYGHETQYEYCIMVMAITMLYKFLEGWVSNQGCSFICSSRLLVLTPQLGTVMELSSVWLRWNLVY